MYEIVSTNNKINYVIVWHTCENSVTHRCGMGKCSGTTSREVFSFEDNLVSCLSQDGVADRLAPPPLTLTKDNFEPEKKEPLTNYHHGNHSIKTAIKLLSVFYTCVWKKNNKKFSGENSICRSHEAKILKLNFSPTRLVYGKIENLGNKAVKVNKFAKPRKTIVFYWKNSEHDHFGEFKSINNYFWGFCGRDNIFFCHVTKQKRFFSNIKFGIIEFWFYFSLRQ